MRIYIQMIKNTMCSVCMVHEGDAAHLHVTTKTQINLHSTQKIRTTVKNYHKTVITSVLNDFRVKKRCSQVFSFRQKKRNAERHREH